MKTISLLLSLTLGCALSGFAQNEPISLSTEVTTTYYTDGSSQSNSRMLFYVGEGSAQRMGFIGAKLKPHLNQAPAILDHFLFEQAGRRQESHWWDPALRPAQDFPWLCRIPHL